MSSEEQVRTTVHQVANRITVDTEQHLAVVLERSRSRGRSRTSPQVRRRPRLAALAAALSVAGVVAAGAALTGLLPGAGPDAGRVAPALVSGTPDGTVPSVFGHTRQSVATLFAELGLQVRYREDVSCAPAGRPVGTEPSAGTPVQPGETVTVLLSYQGATTDCFQVPREAWQFVDFATGRGPSPRFADGVDLFVDGVRTATLTGVEAARGDWGSDSALSILARASEQVVRVGDSYRAPSLQVISGTPPDTWCGVARPAGVRDREALTLTIAFEEADPGSRCPARVALYRTGGAIDTVIAWSDGARGSAQEPIPDVLGLSLGEARARVTAAGYPAKVEELETCQPGSGVVEQAPTQRALEEDRGDDPDWYGPVTLVVEVPHRTRDCARLSEAADAFVRFARGGAPPDWAPEVQQLLGYTSWATVTSTTADDPSSWAFCTGVSPDSCEVSPLIVARGGGEIETGEFSDVTRWPDGQTCELIDRGGLPRGLPVERQIVLYPARLASCAHDWSVWLWIDDQGRITALNLLVPETAAGDR